MTDTTYSNTGGNVPKSERRYGNEVPDESALYVDNSGDTDIPTEEDLDKLEEVCSCFSRSGFTRTDNGYICNDCKKYAPEVDKGYKDAFPDEDVIDVDVSDAAEKDSILLSDIFHSDLFVLIRLIEKGDIHKAHVAISKTLDMCGYGRNHIDKAMAAVLVISLFRMLRDGVEVDPLPS